MRIAIVNDTTIAVEALRRVLLAVPDYQIAWIARDGAEAVAKCARDTPDLILMDLMMPGMDGVEVTRQIMKNSPCAILIVTASVRKHSAKVFEAMGFGALDAASTPVLGAQEQASTARELLAKIATIGKLIGKRATSTQAQKPALRLPPLLAIGSSTGGPNALAAILSRLPAAFPAAIAIVQHVDVQFASGLVEWLQPQTPLSVKVATAGSRLEAGTVAIAATNNHLILKANRRFDYTPDPRDYPYRPSVDVFFKSAAQHWNRPGMAVLLTGMGRDGAQGLSMLRSRGWKTIAQDRQSCVVYGMPKAAVELGAAQKILPLDAIAPALCRHFRESVRSASSPASQRSN